MCSAVGLWTGAMEFSGSRPGDKGPRYIFNACVPGGGEHAQGSSSAVATTKGHLLARDLGQSGTNLVIFIVIRRGQSRDVDAYSH